MSGISREAERMSLLVEDLLLLARLDEGRPLEQEPVALDGVVEEAVDAARVVDAGRPVTLDVEPTTVVGDRDRLRQVIDNLFANVRAHTPPGTPVSVGLHQVDGTAELSVGDSGPGLTEEQAHIGDQYRVGTSILRVTQPRMPCFKLALRFERADMIKLFWKSGLSGVYFAIAKEGELGAGDDVELVEKHPAQVAIADVVKVYKRETTDLELYARVLQAPIAGSWKEEIRERWAQMTLTDAE